MGTFFALFSKSQGWSAQPNLDNLMNLSVHTGSKASGAPEEKQLARYIHAGHNTKHTRVM